METHVQILADLLSSKDKSYKNVRATLIKLNAAIYDGSKENTHSQKTESSTRFLQKILFDNNGPSLHKRDEYYAIVVAIVTNDNPPYIIAEVPLYDFDGPRDQDELNSPTFKKNLNSKKYYATRAQFNQNMPHVGAVVKVKVAKNFPEQEANNSHDSVYLFSTDIRVDPSTNKATINSTKGYSSGLEKSAIEEGLERYKPPINIAEEDLFDLPLDNNTLTSIIAAQRLDPVKKKDISEHVALDLGAESGTPIRACTNFSKVVMRYQEGGAGQYITAFPEKLPGIKINFFHLDKFSNDLFKTEKYAGKDVEVLNVPAGTVIGYVGNTGNSTGPHLHIAIKDSAGSKVYNPLYFFKGTLYVDQNRPAVLAQFGKGPIQLPKKDSASSQIVAAAATETPIATPQEGKPILVAGNQPVPVPRLGKTRTSRTLAANSPAVSRPKLTLVSLQTDSARFVDNINKLGGKQIKIREDIISSLAFIKATLNAYSIPLSCEYLDIKIENKNLNDFEVVGLGIRLNRHAGLTKESRIDKCDYFIGPDYGSPIWGGYKIKVYAKCNTFINYESIKYKPEELPVDLYLYSGDKLKIVKSEMLLLDITKIFNDKGFLFADPDPAFFKNGDIESSNWYKLYNPQKINIGYSYHELLQTVYDRDSNPLWIDRNKAWNGKRFV